LFLNPLSFENQFRQSKLSEIDEMNALRAKMGLKPLGAAKAPQ
jgi:hypothetical protein